MAPSPTSSSHSEGPNVGLIFAAVAGGCLLVGIVAVIFVHFVRVRRNNRGSASREATRFDPMLMLSNPSATSLIPSSTTLWKSDDHDTQASDEYLGKSFDKWHKRNASAESVETVKPLKDEKFAIPPLAEFTPLMSEDTSHSPGKNLAPLIIPDPITSYAKLDSLADNSPYSHAPSSASSDSSVSLYSQASAAPHVTTFPPRLLPPMIPQYADVNKADPPPTSDDTLVIGKLLKERAKRNPNKITRSVSRIERVGSIKAVTGDEDEGENEGEGEREGVEKRTQGGFGSEQRSHPRPRRSKSKRQAVIVPLSAVAEGSDSGASSPSSTHRVSSKWSAPPTALVVGLSLSPPPPATLLGTNSPSPPPPPPPSLPSPSQQNQWQRPQSSLLPLPRPSSPSPSHESLHVYSRSLDGHFSQDPAPPKAHVRQYSAERATWDTVQFHPAGRNVSMHGVLGNL